MKKYIFTLSFSLMALAVCASPEKNGSVKTEPSVFPRTTTLLNKTVINAAIRHILAFDDFVVVSHGGGRAMATLCDVNGNVLSKLPYESDHDLMSGYWAVRKGDTIFVASRQADPRNTKTETGCIVAWNVSNPSAPVRLGAIYFLASPEATHLSPQPTTIALFHRDGRDWLAIAGNLYKWGGFAVVDATDPASMQLVGGIVYTPRGEGGDEYMRPHSVAVLDSSTVAAGCYTSFRRFTLIDVSTPSVPVYLSSVDLPKLGGGDKNASAVLWGVLRLDNDHVAAASLTSGANRNNNTGWMGVRIFNVADRKAPFLEGSCRLDWSAVDRSAPWDIPPSELICVSKGEKDYILLNGGDQGVHVIDATDRANPVFLYNSSPDQFEDDCIRAVAVSPDKTKLYLGSGPWEIGAKTLWVSEIVWGK